MMHTLVADNHDIRNTLFDSEYQLEDDHTHGWMDQTVTTIRHNFAGDFAFEVRIHT